MSIVLTTDKSTLAVVVGAGTVGLRKCALLQVSGWRVRIVDPLLENVPDGVEGVPTNYHAKLLADAQLVVACTNRADVNARIVADALAQGKLVCDTAEPARGNFVFPATWSSGPIQLTLSTGGAAPALAGRLVRQLGESLPNSLSDYVGLLAELRTVVIDKVADEPTRRALLRRFASAEFQQRVEQEGVAAVREEVLREVGSSM